MTKLFQRISAVSLIAITTFLSACSTVGPDSKNIPLSIIEVPEKIDLVVALKNSDFIKKKFKEAQSIANENDPINQFSIDDFEYGIFIADLTNYSITGFQDPRNYCFKALYKNTKDLVTIPMSEIPGANSFCDFADEEFEKQLQSTVQNGDFNIFVHTSVKGIREFAKTQYTSYEPIFKEQFLSEIKSQADSPEFKRINETLKFFGITTPIDSPNFLQSTIDSIINVNAINLIAHLDQLQITMKIDEQSIVWHNYFKLIEGADTAKLAEIITNLEKGRELILTNTTQYEVSNRVEGQQFAIQTQLTNYDLSATLYAYSSPLTSVGLVGAVIGVSIPGFIANSQPSSPGETVLSQIGLLDNQSQARDAQRKATANMVVQAIEAFNIDTGTYPVETSCANDIEGLKVYFPGEQLPTVSNDQALSINGCEFLYDPIIGSEESNYAIYTSVELSENGNLKELPEPGSIPKISRVGGQYYVTIQ